MKIIDYNKNLDKSALTNSAYEVCNNALFPVEYQDVYLHLFGSDDLILKLLLTENDKLAGFGVFENYNLTLDDEIITMLYLSGMVIDPKYQGKNYSGKIIKEAYQNTNPDLISLRTQNITMAKSLINSFKDNLYSLPNNIDKEVINYLRQVEPFYNLDESGVIKNCYANQLYNNLDAIKDQYNIILEPRDALAVVVEPSTKQKTLSKLKKI